MSPQDILQNLDIGLGVAEQEADELSKYFVETNQWKSIFRGRIDIVYGPKGAGKSALYTLLVNTSSEDPNRVILQADSPRGTPIFQNVEADPPTSEVEFQNLWKLYFVALIGNYFSALPDVPDFAKELIEILMDEKLIDVNRETILKRIISWVKHIRPEVSATVDPAGNSSFSGRIVLDDSMLPDTKGRAVSINSLVSMADSVLKKSGKVTWICIDRLDVAFRDNTELEENALSALFHVYLDLMNHNSIKLKIFLRTDIWRRLTSNRGFRESSHIVRQSTIAWSEEQLLNLVMRRLLNNESVVEYYSLKKEDILSDFSKQKEVFYRIFPRQVVAGEKKPDTLSWMLTRTADGSRQTAPRELIQLLNESRDQQLRNIEIGASDVKGNELFGGVAIKKALDEVSRQRLHQTVYSEYPSLKIYIDKLEGQKAEQTNTTLAKLWKTTSEEVQKISEKLVDVGFFEKRGGGGKVTFWIPFLYRPVLKITQGSAED